MKKLISKIAITAALLVGAVMIVGAPANAAVLPTHVVAVASAPVVSFDLNWPVILGLIVSIVLPVIVGLVTKVVTSPSVKAILLAVLAAATGLLTELGNALTAGVTYNLGMGLLFAFMAFITAVAMHFGLWKPTTVAAKVQALGSDPNDIQG